MLRLTKNMLQELAAKRVLILDGAMGTMIQSYNLQEADFRADLLADHPVDLQGNNDILNLTRPDVIAEIYRSYLSAGADIITTNTFNGTSVAQSDYQTEHLVYDINVAAARLAREAADDMTRQTPERPRFVAGSLAPTNRTCSISPDVNDPGLRNITFDALVEAYGLEAKALLDGGVDILMIETVFDPLNAKAAAFAVGQVLRKRSLHEFPVWISGTITDASGRTLTGQTPEAFWISMRHAKPAVIGLNCALGATAMRPFIEEIASIADALVSVHPNAGMPNELGGYDETPQEMAGILAEFTAAGLVNIVGGCCGTTPEYIKAIGRAVDGLAPRIVPPARTGTFLAGLEPLHINTESLFVNVGERTNVAGSRKFARLIREDKIEEALEIARNQVRGGAQIVDVNMDDAMLEPVQAMSSFLNVLASDPEISRVPIMIDSSDWEVIEAGLKRIQGKGIVNSISLKDGEDLFRKRARLVQRYGAAAVVMAFDEEGQASTLERRISICRRAWKVLVEEEGFPPEDVIFDPNIFAVATGLPEHDSYALDFLETCRVIKLEMPGALISGGVSNLSFSFRGNDTVREAMHSAFLYRAITAGMDMGIVNAGQLAVYQEIEPTLLEAVEDVILQRRPDATDRLVEIAAGTTGKKSSRQEDLTWREGTVAERLGHALLTGDGNFIAEDTLAALELEGSPLGVIEGPLMAGMDVVGELFGAGKMFLPQVIRSARIMKKAVAVLDPYLLALSATNSTSAGKVLMATVKGDVHDIGKNIVGVVLGCNNYDIIDLGVMVPVDKIIETAVKENVDVVGLSGLITPSLSEMVHVAQEMQRAGLTVPLLIGGATTSRLHTAVKIAPFYEPGVFYVPDASKAVSVVRNLMNPETAAAAAEQIKQEYEQIRIKRLEKTAARELFSIEEARVNRFNPDWETYSPPVPAKPGVHNFNNVDISELRQYIDWTPFFQAWRVPGRYPDILSDAETGTEATRLFDDAQKLLDELVANNKIQVRATMGLFPASADGDDLVLYASDDHSQPIRRLTCLRQQRRSAAGKPNFSLADFVAPGSTGATDWVGAFVVTGGQGAAELSKEAQDAGDDYQAILIQAVSDRLAEACAEYLHRLVRRDYWAYAAEESLTPAELLEEKFQGIRPAPGYPACPDHYTKQDIFEILAATNNCGVILTENCAMSPAASIAGLYFSHPQSQYFGLGKIGADQIADYAQRVGITPAKAAERFFMATD